MFVGDANVEVVGEEVAAKFQSKPLMVEPLTDCDPADEKLYLYVVLNLKKINKKIIYKILSVIEKKMYKSEKPSKLIFLKKMPKTASGKIIKKKLIETYASNKIREVIL